MTNNIFLDYANLRDRLCATDFSEIEIPCDNMVWLILSTCDNISYDFVLQNKEQLSLEHIIVNPKCDFRNELINECYNDINWNKLTFLTGYRISGSKAPVLNGKRYELFKILENNEDEIDWNLFDVDRPMYELNEDFLKYFYDYIDWNNMISSTHQEIPSKALAIALEHDKIDVNALSNINILSQNFIENLAYASYLLKQDEFEKEYFDRNDFLDDLRCNTDILHACVDPTLYTYLSERLKRSVWIDRAAGVHQHFADDEIDWIDYGGEFDSDSDALACDDGPDYIEMDDLEL